MSATNRRGKPSRAYRNTLKRPTRADYERLVRVAVEAVIRGSEDVLIAFPYLFKFPSDFPKGRLVEKEGLNDVRKIKASRLITWLHKHGHTDITMERLRIAQITFTARWGG